MSTYVNDTFDRIGYNSIPDNGRIGYGSFSVVLDVDKLLAEDGATGLLDGDIVKLCQIPANTRVLRTTITVAKPLVWEPTSGEFGEGETLTSFVLTSKLHVNNDAGTSVGAPTYTADSNIRGKVLWGIAVDVEAANANSNYLSITVGDITSSVGTSNQIIGGKLYITAYTISGMDYDEVAKLNPTVETVSTGGV